jgi:hypothetical protein
MNRSYAQGRRWSFFHTSRALLMPGWSGSFLFPRAAPPVLWSSAAGAVRARCAQPVALGHCTGSIAPGSHLRLIIALYAAWRGWVGAMTHPHQTTSATGTGRSLGHGTPVCSARCQCRRPDGAEFPYSSHPSGHRRPSTAVLPLAIGKGLCYGLVYPRITVTDCHEGEGGRSPAPDSTRTEQQPDQHPAPVRPAVCAFRSCQDEARRRRFCRCELAGHS